MIRSRRLSAFLLLAATFVVPRALFAQAPQMPLLQRAVPLEASLQAARAVGVPTEGVALLEVGAAPAVDDEVSFLATVEEDGKLRQWVVLLRAQHVTQDEKERFPVPERVIYTNLARAPIVFPKEDIGGVAIRTLGPFTAGNTASKGGDVWSGALVAPGYLREGLMQGSLIIGAMKARSLQGTVSFADSPLPEKDVSEGMAVREALDISEESVRGFAGFSPAMLAFFNIATQTKGIDAILKEMIDLPWWRLALGGGRFKEIHFQLVDPMIDMPARYWGLPEGTAIRTFGLVLHLDRKPALHCVFAVTQPRPPLNNSAGIVGLVAIRPDHAGPRLTLSLLAAKPALERVPLGVRPGKR